MTDTREGLVVVGGGPAGHAAATAYRQAGGSGPVRLLSADDVAPYQRPPLSKDYLRGESDESQLPLDEASTYADLGIEVRLGEPVASLDALAHTVTLRSGDVVSYASCVLATGSSPVPLPVPGGDHPDVLQLRSLAQGKTLRGRAERSLSAIVVGSGFIGCEAAVSLALRGLEVTVLTAEELPQVERLGREAGTRLAGWLREAGVSLVGGADIVDIEGGHLVHLADGSEHTADLVLAAVGIAPAVELARSAGLRLEDGRVVTDQHMRTTAPDVYAAGDVALAHHAAAGRRIAVQHWGEALAMGEIAGRSAAGDEAAWSEAPGFWSEIGDHTLKYAAWGDGYDDARLVDHADGAFTVWYSSAGTCVGVLTHERDEDYERGSDLVEQGGPTPVEGRG